MAFCGSRAAVGGESNQASYLTVWRAACALDLHIAPGI
jgi:hypothetical protein